MTALVVPFRAVPPAGKLALVLLGLALASAAGGLFLLAPARARTTALEARQAALHREIAQAQAAVADLARHRLEGAELHQRLEQIIQKLPTEREIPPLYRRVHDAALSAGLALALFQPRDPRVQDHYTEVPISVTAEGTYHQLAAFVERLTALPRVITMGALKLSALDRPAASLRAEMTLATYVYRPAGTPPAPGPAGAQQTPPRPTTPQAVTSAPPPTTSQAVTSVPPPATPQAVSSAPPPTTPQAVSSVAPLATSQTVAPAPTIGVPTVIGLDPPGSALPAYSPRGRRDPFAPASLPAAGNAEPGARRRPLIAAATLTGIVRGPDGPLALVEMPDGLGYILRAGDGIEEARLIRIGRDSVVFVMPPAAGLAGEQIVLALRPAK